MPASTTPYRKLSGRSSMSYQRLYLGPDHLLIVDGRMTESYRRFYFKDLQAVMMGKSVRGAVYNLVLGLFIGFAGIIAAATGEPGGEIFGLIMACFFLLLIGLNVLKGPTCQCNFITAVQSYRISSLGRLKKARKVLARIGPLLEQAQLELNLAQPGAVPPLPQELWAPDQPAQESA